MSETLMEPLQNSAAKQLLGSNYREHCKYTLSFTDEGVMVNRLDTSFGEDEYVEKDGEVVDGYLMSFKLENDKEIEANILSYSDMVKQEREDILPKPIKIERDVYSLYEKPKPSPVTIILCIWMVTFLLMGIYLLTVLIK